MPAAAAPCSAKKHAEVLAPATAKSSRVRVNCDLTLRRHDVVTKRIILEGTAASNTKINCRQARLDGGKGTVNFKRDMLEIRSRRIDKGAWYPAGIVKGAADHRYRA